MAHESSQIVPKDGQVHTYYFYGSMITVKKLMQKAETALNHLLQNGYEVIGTTCYGNVFVVFYR